MSSRRAGLVFVLLVSSGIAGARAGEYPWSLSVEGLTDSNASTALHLTANVQLAAADWLRVGAGAGRSESDFETVTSHSLDAGYHRDLDRLGERGGIGLDVDYWSDDASFDSETIMLPVRFGNNSLHAELAPGYRKLVTAVIDPLDGQVREASFEDRRLRVAVTFASHAWRLRIGGSLHDIDPDPATYDDHEVAEELRRLGNPVRVARLLRDGEFARLRRLLDREQLASLRQLLDTQGPQGLAALLRFQSRRAQRYATFNALARNLSDDEWHVEVTHGFGLHELSLEHAEARFVLDDAESRTDTVRWLAPVGDRWDLLLQVGRTRTDGFEDFSFYSVAATRYFD